MPYDPTPIQNKRLHQTGCALIVVGAGLVIAGYLSDPLDLMLCVEGGIAAALGQLLRVTAE